MPTVTNYAEAKAFINFGGTGGGGFVENYKFNTTDYTDAKGKLTDILQARHWLLPYLWQTVHATVSMKATRNDSAIPTGYSVVGDLLDAESDFTADANCNDKEVSILVRFDTGTGKTTNRLIRALRDSWIDNNLTTLSWTDLTPTFTVVSSSPGDASIDVINRYLATVGLHTKFMNKVPATSPQQYDPLDWTLIQYQRVSFRDMGKGFSSRKARRKARI